MAATGPVHSGRRGRVNPSFFAQENVYPFQSCPKTFKTDASARTGIDGMLQKGLFLTIGIQTQIERQYIFPRPVEECHFTATMGTGDFHIACLPKIRFDMIDGKSGGSEAFGQSSSE